MRRRVARARHEYRRRGRHFRWRPRWDPLIPLAEAKIPFPTSLFASGRGEIYLSPQKFLPVLHPFRVLALSVRMVKSEGESEVVTLLL
jgi:hypothetical protein